MNKNLRALPHIVSTLVIVAAISGCGKEEAKGSSQIAAEVNADEISVHQINDVLNRRNAQAPTPEAAKEMGKAVLEKLIDQQLLVEQAVQSKLDRTPEIVSQLESAKREILARAYVEKLTANLNKVTAEEAKSYFTQHPELFSQRRIYNAQELFIAQPSADIAAEVKTLLNSGKSFDEIGNWLKSKDVKFRNANASRAAEQIPLNTLPQLAKMKEGDIRITENPQGLVVFKLLSTLAKPISEEIAMPRIMQFLGAQRTEEAVQQKLKELRTSAKINYIGDFANPATPSSATADKQPTIENTTASEAPANALEKGVQGLK